MWPSTEFHSRKFNLLVGHAAINHCTHHRGVLRAARSVGLTTHTFALIRAQFAWMRGCAVRDDPTPRRRSFFRGKYLGRTRTGHGEKRERILRPVAKPFRPTEAVHLVAVRHRRRIHLDREPRLPRPPRLPAQHPRRFETRILRRLD